MIKNGKRFLAVLLMLAMLTSMAGCGSIFGKWRKAEKEPELETYTFEGFSITMASGYVEMDAEMYDGKYDYCLQNQDVVLLLVHEMKTDLQAVGLACANATEYIQTLTEDQPFDADIKTRADGSAAFIYEGEGNGELYTYQGVVLDGGDSYWMCQLTTLSERYEEKEAAFTAALATVEVPYNEPPADEFPLVQYTGDSISMLVPAEFVEDGDEDYILSMVGEHGVLAVWNEDADTAENTTAYAELVFELAAEEEEIEIVEEPRQLPDGSVIFKYWSYEDGVGMLSAFRTFLRDGQFWSIQFVIEQAAYAEMADAIEQCLESVEITESAIPLVQQTSGPLSLLVPADFEEYSDENFLLAMQGEHSGLIAFYEDMGTDITDSFRAIDLAELYLEQAEEDIEVISEPQELPDGSAEFKLQSVADGGVEVIFVIRMIISGSQAWGIQFTAEQAYYAELEDTIYKCLDSVVIAE